MQYGVSAQMMVFTGGVERDRMPWINAGVWDGKSGGCGGVECGGSAESNWQGVQTGI